MHMIYTFFSSVFITLTLVLGALYQHVIVLAIIATLSFIAAVLFGTQIPDCYVP